MKLRSRLKNAVLFLALALFSCTTMADYDFSRMDGNMLAGDYWAVAEELDSSAKSIYSKHDKVLQSLDMGMVQHFAGNYADSNSSLFEAESLIFQYYTKSITQAIGSYILNDTIKDYAGETYEDIYTNVFMALNYLHLGKPDDVLVEVRRIDNKLRLASQDYQNFISQSRDDENFSEANVSVEKVEVEFHNSALARYLSMLAYLSEGNRDSAQIDLSYIRQAFSTQARIYDFAMPSSIEEELSVPSGTARLNFIGFTGRAPVKEESVFRYYESISGTYIKYAVPTMKAMGDPVSSIRIQALPSDGGEAYESSLEKIESLEAIALDTYRQRESMLAARAMVRTITKGLLTAGLGIASSLTSDDDSGGGLLFSLLQLLFGLATEATERADVRTSRFFPASAYVGGISLPPGTYDVQVEFYSRYGTVLKSHCERNVTVSAGKMNLIESFCPMGF